MAGIYSSSSSSPDPIEKIGDSPYPYPYEVNAGIPRQNGDGFGQYPRGWVYLPSLVRTSIMTEYVHPHIQLKMSGILIFILIPSQCRDFTSKRRWVWTLPIRMNLFAISNRKSIIFNYYRKPEIKYFVMGANIPKTFLPFVV